MTIDRTELLAALAKHLDEALELDAPGRADLLGRLRAEQPELAFELEALLAQEPALDAARFLADGAWGGDPHPDLPAAALAGRRIGAYTLVRPLGHGGMGTVWLGSRSDGRYEGHVAIKLLNLALLDPVGSERFRREGSALARLAHPNIARLVDAGVTEGGQPYLVLEHVEGVRIDQYCDERRLGPKERIGLFQQVLAAVAHAHANLIVHRDIKPSNILVTGDGAVKLLDFGIAKLLELDGAGAERTELTAHGGLPFTPEYAAPEQVTGGSITTATDVYALGVLLYLLLAGRHPTAPGRTTSAEHLRAVVDTDAARLSTAVSAAAAGAPDIAAARASTADRLRRLYLGDLDNILAKALRKDPSARYQAASALADDLRRFLLNEPVSARADSLSYRTGKFVRRHRAPLALGTLVAAALVATTGFSVAQMREAQRQADVAQYETRRAEAQIEFQGLLMSQAGDRPFTMREIVDRGRAVLERQYEGDPRFLGGLLLQLSRRYSELGDPAQRRQVLLRADSMATAFGTPADVAEVRCDFADYWRTQGEYDSARATLAAADALRRTAHSPAVDEWCLRMRAQVAVETGDAATAGTAMREAIASMERRGRAGQDAYIETQLQLAGVLDSEGRFRESVEVFEGTLAAIERVGRRGTIIYSAVQHNYGVTLVKLGELLDAEGRLHEALLRAAVGAGAAPVHPQPLIHYAEVALSGGHADSAVKYFAQLTAQAAADSNRYWQGRGTFGLVRAQARLGALDDARATAATFRRLRHEFPRLTSTDDQVPDTLSVEGWIALAAGDTARAHSLFMESLRAYDFFDGKKRNQQRAVAVQAAETALVLGKPDSALTLARLAGEIATRDSLAETRSGFVGEARLIEARAVLAAGDTAAAVALLDRAIVALRTGAGPEHRRTREAAGLRERLSRSGRGEPAR